MGIVGTVSVGAGSVAEVCAAGAFTEEAGVDFFPPLPTEIMRAITATAAAMPGISHLGIGRPGSGFGGWRFRVSGRTGSVSGRP